MKDMTLKEMLEHLIELSEKGLARSTIFSSAEETYNHRFNHAPDTEKEEALRFVQEVQKNWSSFNWSTKRTNHN
jgi:hypothetical protein